MFQRQFFLENCPIYNQCFSFPEYSSSSRKLSSGGRYESSSYESSGYSRRESGSRIEASVEGSASSRYESKYSSSTVDGSKYAIDAESETTSKLDSIAAKYGIGNGRTETSIESSYETARNGTESKYSKLANGSVSTGELKISKSESQDGKPVFSKTLEGQNIERKWLHTSMLETPYTLVLVYMLVDD